MEERGAEGKKMSFMDWFHMKHPHDGSLVPGM
jgi:hypothetical protein